MADTVSIGWDTLLGALTDGLPEEKAREIVGALVFPKRKPLHGGTLSAANGRPANTERPECE
jgi:hypothetical protein